MSIAEIVASRGITEILHFTTHRGLLGVLGTQTVKSTKRAPSEAQLEFIYKQNTKWRKDTRWLDYVSMSISRINSKFFEASERWHLDEEIWWCALSFKPSILSDDGVYFATTNNIYTGVKRGQGAEGLERLFADRVHQFEDRYAVRYEGMPSHHTTCVQAEVLYPKELATEALQRIYVVNGMDHDKAHGQQAATGHASVEVVIQPNMFG